MSSTEAKGVSGASVVEDAVTVPRIRATIGDDDPTHVLLSSSALKDAAEPLDRAALEALVGRTISDRYLIHELIGHGGMGAVYRGEQVHLRKRVAIKILLPDVGQLRELVLRFEREAIAGAHVTHPNVVGAIDFGQLEDKSHYLILEYVEGTPLKDLIAEGPLPVERALAIARQIATALAAVHEKSIVHRDVKPQNILLTAGEQVKLLDFGLAKVNVELLSENSRNTKPSPALTSVGTVMGTFTYMAPEAARGMEMVDARSDLYALGVMMYEMLTGKRPFEEKDPALLFKKLRTEDPPSMRERAPEVAVPPRVEAVVMRLIQREPERRYASAKEVIQAIDEATAAPQGKAVEMAFETTEKAPEPVVEKPSEPAQDKAAPAPAQAKKLPGWIRHPMFLASTGLLLVGVLVLVAVLARDSSDGKETPPMATSAAASASAEVQARNLVTEVDGLDAQGWRDRMKKATLKKDWAPAAKAFLALAQIDPELATGMELRETVLAVVTGIGFETSFPESDQVFDVLTNRLGPAGLDVLFHVMRTRGGSKASVRASNILAKPEVMANATPALRIAFELRSAACPDKRALFGRAVNEGDQRALDELLILQQTRCSPKREPCCYREDQELKDSIAKLRSRSKL